MARSQTLNTSSSSRIRSSSREPFDGRTTTFCTVPLSVRRISEHQEKGSEHRPEHQNNLRKKKFLGFEYDLLLYRPFILDQHCFHFPKGSIHFKIQKSLKLLICSSEVIYPVSISSHRLGPRKEDRLFSTNWKFPF